MAQDQGCIEKMVGTRPFDSCDIILAQALDMPWSFLVQ